MQPSVIREGSPWDVWLVGTRGQEMSVWARPGLVHKGPGRHFLLGWSAPLKIVPEGVRVAQKGAPFFAMLREEHRGPETADLWPLGLSLSSSGSPASRESWTLLHTPPAAG